MDGATSVSMSPKGDYVYVVGYLSDSIAVVDVSDPGNVTVAGSITGDSTNI